MKKIYQFLMLSVLLVILCAFCYEKARSYYAVDEIKVLDGEGFFFLLDNNLIQEEIYCFYNNADGNYYLFLPSFADLRDVKVVYQGALDCFFQKDGTELFLESGDDIRELALDQSYHFCFKERDGQTIEEGNLIVMRSSKLPALFIETESGTMESVDADKSYKEPGIFTLHNENGNIECRDTLDHITGRGNSTWNTDKKSYGVKLKNGADLFGMGYADKWILLSNVQDDAYIRNKITYDMAIAAGMEGATQSRYIDLYLNHRYHGMYQLCEKVEIGTNRIRANDLEAENKYLNEDYDIAEPFGDETRKGVALGNTPGNITGGYLLERDIWSKYRMEKSGFKTSVLGDSYTIKSPEGATESQVDYILTLFNEAEKAILDKEGINPDTGRSYLEYIDLKSFAQKYIIEELSRNNGGGSSSSFFYKPNDEISTRIFCGPVWDYDKAYGILKNYNSNTRDLGYLTLRVETTQLFKELYKHREFRQMVYECYRDFFSGYIEKIYEDKIDRYIEKIKDSANMDGKRWQSQIESLCASLGSADTLNERAEYIKVFLKERKRFLDMVWNEGIKESNVKICNVTFLAEDFYRNTTLGVVKGERLEAIPDGSVDSGSQGHPELVFLGWYDKDTRELFDITKPIERDMVLSGKWEVQHEQP